jgi:cytochrome b561
VPSASLLAWQALNAGLGSCVDNSLMSYLVGLAFLAILGALASALYFMLKDGRGKPKTSHMARALAFRVGFSILLFLCVLLAWKLGYIRPTGLPVSG